MTDREFDMPWFPFWASDFINSRQVRLMAPEEVGVYILLLGHEWEDGPLPDDPVTLSLLSNGADSTTVERVLNGCFDLVEGSWVNPRLESIREEQIEKRLQRVRAGRASAKARKSKRRKGEEGSNGRSTGVQRPYQRAYQRNGNESESEVEVVKEKEKLEQKERETPSSESAEPIADMWEVWIDELGGKPPHPSLTAKRRQKLKALYREQLADEDDPLATFRKVLEAIQASDHHMSQRSYHLPESTFRNEDRRDRWAKAAKGDGPVKKKSTYRRLRIADG